MKKRNGLSRFAIAGVVTLAALHSFPASAGEVRERQERQRERIEQGVLDQSLTGAEARRLRREQAKVGRMARRLRSEDGKLDRCERRKLNRVQDRASRHISRARHNRRSAG